MGDNCCIFTCCCPYISIVMALAISVIVIIGTVKGVITTLIFVPYTAIGTLLITFAALPRILSTFYYRLIAYRNVNPLCKILLVLTGWIPIILYPFIMACTVLICAFFSCFFWPFFETFGLLGQMCCFSDEAFKSCSSITKIPVECTNWLRDISHYSFSSIPDMIVDSLSGSNGSGYYLCSCCNDCCDYCCCNCCDNSHRNNSNINNPKVHYNNTLQPSKTINQPPDKVSNQVSNQEQEVALGVEDIPTIQRIYSVFFGDNLMNPLIVWGNFFVMYTQECIFAIDTHLCNIETVKEQPDWLKIGITSLVILNSINRSVGSDGITLNDGQVITSKNCPIDPFSQSVFKKVMTMKNQYENIRMTAQEKLSLSQQLISNKNTWEDFNGSQYKNEIKLFAKSLISFAKNITLTLSFPRRISCVPSSVESHYETKASDSKV